MSTEAPIRNSNALGIHPLRTTFRLCISILLMICISACMIPNTAPYMMQPIPIPGSTAEPVFEDERVRHVMMPGSRPIQEGDLLRYLTLDGKRHFMKVSVVGPDFIAGKWGHVFNPFFMNQEKPVRFQDIVFLERKGRKSSNLYSRFPLLDPMQPGDPDFSCLELEEAIVRVNVLRRAIDKELRDMGWEEFSVVLNLGIGSTPKNPREWTLKARSANRDRLIRLIELWVEKDCGKTTGTFDEEAVERLLTDHKRLRRDLDNGTVTEGEYWRTTLKAFDASFPKGNLGSGKSN